MLQASLQADWSGLAGGGGFGVTADQHTVQGVAATPGWEVVSAFYLEDAQATLILNAIMLVSQAGLIGRVRIYDLTAGAAVAGSTLALPVSTLTDTRLTSGNLGAAMPAGRIYQIQIECTGGATVADFATLRSAVVSTA